MSTITPSDYKIVQGIPGHLRRRLHITHKVFAWCRTGKRTFEGRSYGTTVFVEEYTWWPWLAKVFGLPRSVSCAIAVAADRTVYIGPLTESPFACKLIDHAYEATNNTGRCDGTR